MIVGRTVHVVPIESGGWQVAGTPDFKPVFRSRAAALRAAKELASENQPSQVVFSDVSGDMEQVARFRLPVYSGLDTTPGTFAAGFEAAVKLMVYSDLAEAGIFVQRDLVKKAERALKRVADSPAKRKPRRAA